MIGFRHCDPRVPFLWEGSSQPEARWNGAGDGPVHYFADTPDGAWAEFVRHEEIKDLADLPTIRRAIWAVDLGDEPSEEPSLPIDVVTGGRATHAACQAEARRLRGLGVKRLSALSAALLPGRAGGRRVDGGFRPGPPRDGKVIVLFGLRPDLVGWAAADEGRPRDDVLSRVRHY